MNASIRLVTYVVRKIPSKPQLVKLLPTFVQAVVDEFSSEDINVRKTAVSCFIDLFMVVGHEFQPYVDNLGDLQLKLVIERMKQIQNKRRQAERR